MESQPFMNISNRSYGYQLMVFVFITLVSYLIFSLLGLGILLIFGEQGLESMQSLDFDSMSKADINLYKVMQIISSIGIFVIPAIISPLSSREFDIFFVWNNTSGLSRLHCKLILAEALLEG